MKIAAIIPARFASTRFPGKPLHLLAGKPLVQHVWERCQEADVFSQIIIATDDMRIVEAAFAFGAEVALTSPKHQSGTDRIAEVAKKLPKIGFFLNVQGDEPLVNPKLLKKLAKEMAKEKLEMITAATPFPADNEADPVDNPNAVKVILDRNNNAIYFSRSVIPFARNPKAEIQYYRHQGIYGYSRKFLLQFVKWRPTMLEQAEQLEQLRALEHGAKIRVVINKFPSLGVDTPEDARQADLLLSQRKA
jgi:3-deoxy-manno-octulosonate cytidylyltransferase (CMP-KDO synthetase)